VLRGPGYYLSISRLNLLLSWEQSDGDPIYRQFRDRNEPSIYDQTVHISITGEYTAGIVLQDNVVGYSWKENVYAGLNLITGLALYFNN